MAFFILLIAHALGEIIVWSYSESRKDEATDFLNFKRENRIIADDSCAPGCMYSDMKNDLCPNECSGECFANCNENFCSPNCRFDDLESGLCSEYCTDECLKKYSNCKSIKGPDEDPFLYVYILAPIGGIIMLIPIIICVVYWIRRKCHPIPPPENPQNHTPLSSGSNKTTEVSKTEKIMLTQVEFTSDTKFLGEKVCSIDLEDIVEGKKVIITPCQHLFHIECLQEWFRAKKRRSKCPNCQRSLKGYAIESKKTLAS